VNISPEFIREFFEEYDDYPDEHPLAGLTDHDLRDVAL
jgi:hypothetical protein